MKKIYWCLFCSLILFQSNGQNTIGLPDIVNHPKKSYGGGLQNWDISQDDAGNIFVANNEGLLSYDGRFWTIHPLPNRTIVRAALVARKGRVYVGGQDELGFFEADQWGKLVYKSLLPKIPFGNRNFGDVWDIVQINQDIWFRSAKFLFKFSGNGMAVFPASSEWGFLGSVNEKVYAQDFEKGLLIYENGAWRSLFINNPSPANDAITGLHSMNGNQLMVIHLKSGVFVTDGAGLKPMKHPDLSIIQSSRIYATEKLPDERFALKMDTPV